MTLMTTPSPLFYHMSSTSSFPNECMNILPSYFLFIKSPSRQNIGGFNPTIGRIEVSRRKKSGGNSVSEGKSVV